MHRPRATAAALVLTAAGVLAVGAPTAAAPVALDCAQAGARVEITVDTVLDPSCTWAGFDVTASGVTLDCQGATVRGQGGTGILVTSPVDVAQTGVTVRGCHTDGFVNGMRVTREGFRLLPEGSEYAHTTGAIAIEDSTVRDSHGVGIFVDGYVSDVTIRRVAVHGAGSTGIYLEAGSIDNVVTDVLLEGNGFGENGPGGQLFTLDGTTFRYWGPGREGLAIDGSRRNVVRNTTFRGNAAGGIFLYTNCGEFVHERPERWFERRTGAEDNLIEGNTFEGGATGVWIGSRMGENTLPMDCSDPAYAEGAVERYVLDRAARTTVRGNTFADVTYGVRVEDDGALVEGNTFTADDGTHHAVLVGTRVRTGALDRPVEGTVVRDNVADIVGNGSPYRWFHGERGSTVEGNRSQGVEEGWCEGPEIPHNAFIFVEHLVVEDPAGPPTPQPDYIVPTLGALPQCGTAVLPEEEEGPPAGPAAPGPDAGPSALPAVPVVADAHLTG